MQPRSLSLYRGQSKDGIGDGPGALVHHGEQYLAADPPLGSDPGLLEALRTWMTLDTRAADHQALGARLEAWSYLPYHDLRIVCRLTTAQQYAEFDRRAAYFAHARAWRAADVAGAFDPGAYLGCGEAFDRPWQRRRAPSPEPAPPGPSAWAAHLAAQPALAAQLLACLYQGIVERRPVIVAAPLLAFAAGEALPALTAFARAALPLPLKRDCRIRVFTCDPYHFVKELKADLVVAPDDLAAGALRARTDATLLDFRGGVRSGRPPAPGVVAYAEAVVQRARKLPDALLAFAGRVGEHLAPGALPEAKQVDLIKVVYNVSAADGEEQLGELFSKHLLRIANEGGVDAGGVLSLEEWQRIPSRRLVDVVVMGTEQSPLTPSGRAFQERVEAEVRRRGVPCDAYLARLWTGQWLTAGQRLRLIELLRASLLAPVAAVQWTRTFRLEDLEDADVATTLLTELEGGVLGARDTAELGRAAARSVAVVDVLCDAMERGVVDAEWMRPLLAGEVGPSLHRAALRALSAPLARRASYQGVLPRLLERLATSSRLPPELGLAAAGCAERSRAGEALDHHLLLLEIVARAGDGRLGGLVQRLWDLGAPDARRRVVEVAVDPDRRALVRGDVVREDGALSVPADWVPEVAGVMLASALVDRLSPDALGALAEALPAEDPAIARAAAALDRSMTNAPIETTRALVQARRWTWWRRHTGLPPSVLRACALAWLRCDAHMEGGATEQAGLRVAWSLAMADVGPVLSYVELDSLFDPAPPATPAGAFPPPSSPQGAPPLVVWRQPRWPVLAGRDDARGHLREDIRELARCVDDVQGLLLLARALEPSSGVTAWDTPLLHELHARSRLAERMNWDTFLHLARSEEIYTRAIAALGRAHGYLDECWEKAANIAVPAVPGEQPLARLARTIGADPRVAASLRHHGFDNLLAVLARYPVLLRLGPARGDSLPALDLAFVLNERSLGSVGVSVLQVLRTLRRDDDRRAPLARVDWWRSVLRSLRRPLRVGLVHHADDGWEHAWERMRSYAMDSLDPLSLSPLEMTALFDAQRRPEPIESPGQYGGREE